MTYDKYMLYLHFDEIEFQIAEQSFYHWHLNLLAVYISDIWLIYVIDSHVIAYWSRTLLIILWLFSVSCAYAVHILDLFKFVQILSLMSSAEENKDFKNTDMISVLHMQCVCYVLIFCLQFVLQFQYFEL